MAVVSGTANVVRDDEVLTLTTNESVYIHKGQKHQLTNQTDNPLIVIEVQSGDYLGEDDIVPVRGLIFQNIDDCSF